MSVIEKKSQNKKWRIGMLLLGLMVVLGITLPGLWNIKKKQEVKTADLERILSENYDGIFTAMYNIEPFSEEDFTVYRGLKILKTSYVHENTSDIAEYLEKALQSDNPITNVYLGVDPACIWYASKEKVERWNQNLDQDLLCFISAYPEVSFEVMLAFPQLTYWKELSETKRESIVSVYLSFINRLAAYPNVVIYYPGSEEWLIKNPGNYKDTFTTNELLAQKLMLLTFCDRNYQITADNANMYFDRLKLLVQEETEYPDLSEWCMVFLGDSIFGNYSGSFSIPGAVNGLSAAQVYNCAKGGTGASNEPNAGFHFLNAVNAFINKDRTVLGEEEQFSIGLKNYLADDHTNKKLCFIVNYGLNDYFSGHAVSAPDQEQASYENGLRMGIEKLKEAYPEAYILVLTPSYCSEFSDGTERMSDRGGVLTDYVDAAMKISEELEVDCMNLYSELGVNSENHLHYLADGTHFNEAGRFMVAEHIVEHIGNISATP